VTLIDVGGYRLDLRVAGRGSPAVVCVSAAGWAHEPWERFADLVSDTTTVITYGRPALGGSDPLPPGLLDGPVGGVWPAEQLRVLLDAADIPPPYVLAGSSIGGYIADQYTARWPQEVVGLVQIDASPMRDFAGGVRFPDPFDDGDEPGGLLISWGMAYAEQRDQVARNHDGRFVVLSAALGTWQRIEPRDWHRPLTVAEVAAEWVEMQREWTQRLDAVQIVAAHAGHHVQLDQPELGAAVVREVVDAARDGRPVEFDRPLSPAWAASSHSPAAIVKGSPSGA
jgi:pimeloyl-ACP methyl ester carboxylesterase